MKIMNMKINKLFLVIILFAIAKLDCAFIGVGYNFDPIPYYYGYRPYAPSCTFWGGGGGYYYRPWLDYVSDCNYSDGYFYVNSRRCKPYRNGYRNRRCCR